MSTDYLTNIKRLFTLELCFRCKVKSCGPNKDCPCVSTCWSLSLIGPPHVEDHEWWSLDKNWKSDASNAQPSPFLFEIAIECVKRCWIQKIYFDGFCKVSRFKAFCAIWNKKILWLFCAKKRFFNFTLRFNLVSIKKVIFCCSSRPQWSSGLSRHAT